MSTSVKSLALVLVGGADGRALPFFAALVTTGFMEVAGALASDWSRIVEYVGWSLPLLDISYAFGAFSTCEFPALSTLLDAKRLYVNYEQNN